VPNCDFLLAHSTSTAIASNALLTEPALGNDIAAMLLLPQHDFEFAHSEGKIENDGLYAQILAP
jgi:hypothetical protein